MLQHSSSTVQRIWKQFAGLEPRLDECDDVELWRTVVGQTLGDAGFLLCSRGRLKSNVLAEIGRCSHWLRPHQYRWNDGGGFAAPFGYGGSGYSLRGWPEFDWSFRWTWHSETEQWIRANGVRSKRALVFRVAIPSRTMKHRRAAIHTIWTPGSPINPKQKSTQLYGFRYTTGSWHMTAYASGNKHLYEAAN